MDEAAERRARAAGDPGGAAMALSAGHRRRRALYVHSGSGPDAAGASVASGYAGAAPGAGGVTAEGVAGLAPPAAAGRAARGGGGRAAMAAFGSGAIRRGADDPELQTFVKRELQVR